MQEGESGAGISLVGKRGGVRTVLTIPSYEYMYYSVESIGAGLGFCEPTFSCGREPVHDGFIVDIPRQVRGRHRYLAGPPHLLLIYVNPCAYKYRLQ